VIEFLTDWLITHIVNEDKRIGRHLASIAASREGTEAKAEDTDNPPPAVKRPGRLSAHFSTDG